jgi:hypothetical protein
VDIPEGDAEGHCVGMSMISHFYILRGEEEEERWRGEYDWSVRLQLRAKNASLGVCWLLPTTTILSVFRFS